MDSAGAQTIFYLTCTTISSVDLARNGKIWQLKIALKNILCACVFYRSHSNIFMAKG